MNIPNKVKIGYKHYKVNLQGSNLVNENQVCYGTIEYDNEQINISKLYSENSQKCTLIYECIQYMRLRMKELVKYVELGTKRSIK